MKITDFDLRCSNPDNVTSLMSLVLAVENNPKTAFEALLNHSYYYQVVKLSKPDGGGWCQIDPHYKIKLRHAQQIDGKDYGALIDIRETSEAQQAYPGVAMLTAFPALLCQWHLIDAVMMDAMQFLLREHPLARQREQSLRQAQEEQTQEYTTIATKAFGKN